MNIDRHNYEEFFILYLDNELSASDRQLVEDFAAANPDLKAELDLLLQSKLEPQTEITFDGKAALLKHEEEIAAETSSILLYMDGEMDPTQKKSFEEWIAQRPGAKKELELFQQTKIQPEHIVFPYKQSLYRQEERRVVAIRWWRMAAAAVLLLGISTSTFMFNQKRADRRLAENNRLQQEKNAALLAKSNAKTATPETVQLDAITPAGENHASTVSATQGSTDIDNNTASLNDKNELKQDRHNSPYNAHEHSVELGKQPVTADATGTDTPSKINRYGELSNTVDASFAVNNDALQADPSLTIQKQINPLPAVTQEEDQPLDIMNEPGKKNKLRGFFRKITRTFEKTTNIKATDGEDRLLVGGLAIKF